MNQHPFERALVLLMRPLARFALRHALKIQELTEIAKRTLVQEAARELGKGTPANNRLTSRISAMTGIHRRDVLRILSNTESENEIVSPRSLIMKIVGAWIGVRKYQDRSGLPRGLTCEGATSEFSELVSSVSKDLNPYTVLRELQRAGMVIKKENKLLLQHEVLTPRDDIVQGFRIVADDINDLTKAAEDNLTISPPQHLHIRTSYDNIALSAVPTVRKWLIRKGEKMHAEARRFLSRYDADLNSKLKDESAGARVVLGSFGMCETSQEDRDEKSN